MFLLRLLRDLAGVVLVVGVVFCVLREGRGMQLERHALNHEDLAFLQYTGGTTGVAKGAMLSHSNLVANMQQASAWLGENINEGKEIIITAGGKNVAPAPLEALLASNPLVAHAVVIGDNRPYIATLLTLDPDELQTWLTKNDRVDLGTAELVNDPQLRAELQKNLDLANKTVSAAEGIRRFVILPVEFTEETGYLTPKLSVKRHLVLADFAEQVESLY